MSRVKLRVDASTNRLTDEVAAVDSCIILAARISRLEIKNTSHVIGFS